MTASNTTPEGFRTAAYLATRARLDAARSRSGKTNRSVDCKPPNTQCGGRCIPPSWDCRIKGEGPDPHLRAVRTDPVSGLANIERGIKRIGKGLRKGSFSEIEGGKRAIVRGVVKATPGDIQRKKALQAQLERRAAGIALGLSIVGFGLFSHNQLKRAPFYRDGVGRRIDDAVSAGINRVLDATPGIGARRAERRAAAGAAGMAATARAATTAASGPETLRSGLLRTPTDLERRSTEYGNSRVLFNRISSVDIDAANRGTNLETWRQTSLESFWGTKRTNAAGPGDGSTFSEPATHEFLSRQFGFRLDRYTNDTQVRRAVSTALTREAVNLQGLARQQGVNLKDADARNAFLNRIVGPSTANFPADVRDRAVKNLDDVLGNPVSKGREATISRKELADRYYRETRDGFDQYFARIADEVRQTPGVAMPKEQRKGGYDSLMISARIGHSRYLAGRLNKTIPSMGPGVSDVVAKEYFATQVQKSSTFSLSDREVRVAASELAGRNITSIGEATQYLQSNGFPRLVAVQRAPSAASAGLRSAASLTSRARSIMARAGNENMSLEAAYRQARAEMRGDAADLPPRVAAYLQTRNDFVAGKKGQGKPCGESHIPKAHECNIGKGKTAPPEGGNRSNTGAKVAVAAALVGAAALGGRAAFKNRQNIPMYKNAAKYVDTGIKTMSSTKVRNAISKLPTKFQEPANKLVGKAKVGLAFVAADAQGMKLTKVDPINNFSTFKNPTTGHVMSVGAVDDTLVTFVSTPSGKAGAFDKFGIAFQTDLSFDQKEGLSKAQGLAVSKQVKSMFSAQLDEMPENAVLFNNPYKDDGLGDKRSAIYKRFKFTELPGVRGGNMWALKNQGKLTKIPPEQADYVAKLIRGDAEDTRIDLKCGKGSISEGEKCTKGAATKVNPNAAASNRKLAVTAAAAGAVALTAALTAKSWTPAVQRIWDNARVVTPKDATYLTEGRSGKVWLSNDNKFVIKTSKGKVNMKKFTNEMNTQNALHSAGVSVPKIHNVDAKRGVVMMEYLNGYADSSKIPAASRVPVLRKTVSELQKMSALNVSHGDLHPGNIMAKGTDVKIIDFGNAGPVTKNGLSDISNIQLQAKTEDPKLFAAIVANRKPLEAKISSGKALTQDDFNSFYTRLQRDLKQTSAA